MTDARAARKAELAAEVERLESKISTRQERNRRDRTAADRLKADMRRLELAPEPPAEVDVVRFVKKFGGGRAYHFAAIAYRLHGEKCPHRRWSVTGKAGLTGVTWDRVAALIAEDEAAPVKVQWLQNSIVQPFAELGFTMSGRARAEEAAVAFAAKHDGQPYVYGPL
ncbi:hypothetical protein [Nocardia phage NBR1]|uniref:hypothetical protein n=1 Tax=Nocardia phage NBR1 TaxID=1109711 RepID=UPI00023EEDEF|nr:hypothetical protein NoPhNBR1_gp44 [Nocardia phage NBR1]AEV52257.1 hypothetical protein [Nocardia phage NBR1]